MNKKLVYDLVATLLAGILAGEYLIYRTRTNEVSVIFTLLVYEWFNVLALKIFKLAGSQTKEKWERNNW